MADAGNPNEAPQRLWGGRFEEAPDALVQAYTSSIQTDLLLFRHDIAGSRAHARMLAAQGIIDTADAATIIQGLDQVESEIESGGFEINHELEDIHTHVEARLGQIIGADAAGRLHTARSRNDQVALDTRMFVRDAIVQAVGAVRGLQASLIELAERSLDVYLPGYTHLQRAQPVLFAHHLLAYLEMLDRDADRLVDSFARADVMPLGSAALAGAAYPLDRQAVADELGFEAISRNSIDAVSSRDYIVEFLSNAAICMVNISRLCEDVILWSSAEFGVLQFADAFTTGSSIMPQKRNPDIAELARGRSGKVLGHLTGLLTTLKGLPLAYNRDLQEDKSGLFDTAETLIGTLHVLARALLTAQVNGDRARAMVDQDPFILATDYADYITRTGVPFREAHGVVGRLVRLCEQRGCGLSDLTLEDLQSEHPSFEADAVGMTVQAALESRDIPGGTAPSQVLAALEEAKERLQLKPAGQPSSQPPSQPAASSSEPQLETGLNRAQRRAAERAAAKQQGRR
ncbi:MAG: argininosuccinate lyase [Chloroflexi bacterium]|nr:argininosuccinate lyase [Chloroflexota bacterium]MYJ93074.1 argininosuccinate lyase [Chloroflexota bacterium]